MTDATATTTPERPYRVALADDDARVRQALAGLLAGAEFDVRGVFADGFALRECCAHEHLDLALVDVEMPGGGPNLARALLRESPSTIVAVYTAHGSRRTREAMIDAGAAAVLDKGGTSDLRAAILALLHTTRPTQDG